MTDKINLQDLQKGDNVSMTISNKGKKEDVSGKILDIFPDKKILF